MCNMLGQYGSQGSIQIKDDIYCFGKCPPAILFVVHCVFNGLLSNYKLLLETTIHPS